MDTNFVRPQQQRKTFCEIQTFGEIKSFEFGVYTFLTEQSDI